MMRKLNKMGSRGDTIVEVLLAIAVISAVLGGAFVSAKHSLSGSQRTQERSEAIKLVESQIEFLRTLSTQSNEVFTASSPFCIVNQSGLTTLPASANECRQGPDGRYALAIHREADGVTFNITAEWDKVGASGTDRSNMYYKVHQGSTP